MAVEVAQNRLSARYRYTELYHEMDSTRAIVPSLNIVLVRATGKRIPIVTILSPRERFGFRKGLILIFAIIRREEDVVISCRREGCRSPHVMMMNAWVTNWKLLSQVPSVYVTASTILSHSLPGLRR